MIKAAIFGTKGLTVSYIIFYLLPHNYKQRQNKVLFSPRGKLMDEKKILSKNNIKDSQQDVFHKIRSLLTEAK